MYKKLGRLISKVLFLVGRFLLYNDVIILLIFSFLCHTDLRTPLIAIVKVFKYGRPMSNDVMPVRLGYTTSYWPSISPANGLERTEKVDDN